MKTLLTILLMLFLFVGCSDNPTEPKLKPIHMSKFRIINKMKIEPKQLTKIEITSLETDSVYNKEFKINPGEEILLKFPIDVDELVNIEIFSADSQSMWWNNVKLELMQEEIKITSMWLWNDFVYYRGMFNSMYPDNYTFVQENFGKAILEHYGTFTHSTEHPTNNNRYIKHEQFSFYRDGTGMYYISHKENINWEYSPWISNNALFIWEYEEIKSDIYLTFIDTDPTDDFDMNTKFGRIKILEISMLPFPFVECHYYSGHWTKPRNGKLEFIDNGIRKLFIGNI
jgi:hypothetical protein